MPKCEHGLTSKECYVCASPKHAEQAEKQEPVAWMSSHDVGFKRSEFGDTPTVPLYTTPQPQREWVGLTDEDEIDWDGGDLKSLVKAIEAKLKEKNT